VQKIDEKITKKRIVTLLQQMFLSSYFGLILVDAIVTFIRLFDNQLT